MRVLITTDAVGGVWQYSATLANTLAERFGVQIMLAVCGPQPTTDQTGEITLGAVANGGSIELENLGIPMEWEGGDEQAYADGRQALLRLALKWRAHILHANEHHLGQIGASGLPVLVVSHSDLCSWQAAMGSDATVAVSGEYMQRVTVGLNNASLVVAPSTAVADSLCRWFGYGNVVRVIPNGVSPAPPGLARARTIDAMMAGRLWDPAKNLICFQHAVNALPRGTFVAAGSLTGPGTDSPAVTEGKIHYPGLLAHDELRRLLARAQILVSPARYEPFGLVAVEAALAGCCLVLSDIPSYRSLWENSAVYVDPQDPEALRTVIQDLLNDRDARHTLARRARSRAQSRYTAERMGHAYLATYQRLALRHGIAF